MKLAGVDKRAASGSEIGSLPIGGYRSRRAQSTDDIAERVRKLGGTTIRSIGHIGRLQRVSDNEADYVTASDMLSELRDDNIQLAARLRETHSFCNEYQDVATASLIEIWIDEAEKRTWFLFEATRYG